MATAIKVENLSKIYRLGEIGTGTISRDIERFVKTKILKHEDPFLKIGETNDRATKGASDIVYSLKDINFEIEQGDAVGIIGRNGAGKSTLLKILSRVTSPTTGKINIKGRVASLLEVGTGFHPELTGRENIYLNGAILGMRKREIDRKLDEIIDFSGVERYIDTPVKRYSSGMYVRLAFAVAAHLESEILIVDEVLAVGDAEFQKKCLGKMGEVSKGEGRSVLFVSHNITAIANLCNKILLLQNGESVYNGFVNQGLELYFSNIYSNDFINSSYEKVFPDDEDFKLIKLNIYQKGSTLKEFYTAKEITIEYIYLIKRSISGLRIGFDIIDTKNNIILFRTFHDDFNQNEITNIGDYKLTAIIPSYFLNSGNYIINIAIGIHNVKWITFEKILYQFSIVNIGGINKHYADNRPGLITPKIDWSNL